MLRFGVSLAMTLVVAATAPAVAQAGKPVEKAPSSIAGPALQPGVTAKPVSPPPANVWSPEEIAAAKAQCAAAMRGLNVLVSYEEPIKDGDCGNPAPIRLVRLDNVTFSPAALINCGMLAPLHTWISKELQPLAKRKLGARIATVEVMSDYSCRTAFGRVGRKLSQHAYVDALDIRSFITEKKQTVSVLENWGATQRDIAAARKREEQILQAAHAAAAKHADAAAVAQAGKPERPTEIGQPATTASLGLRPSQSDVDVVNSLLPGGTNRQQLAARLGGPPDRIPSAGKATSSKLPAAKTNQIASLSRAATIALSRPTDSPTALFLRAAHASACRIFGTTLGPEANEMHRNHFHVDMAQRKIKNICD